MACSPIPLRLDPFELIALDLCPLNEASQPALIDIDFVNGLYWAFGAGAAAITGLSGVTTASVGARLHPNAAGALQAYASGVLPINSAGFWAEPTRTNLCTHRNATPVDLTNITHGASDASTLTVVDDAAELAAAPELAALLASGALNGKVLKLDNSLGTTPAYFSPSGTLSTLNPHTCTAHIRGTGQGYLRLSNVAGLAIPLTAGYSRHVVTQTPPGTGSRLRVYAQPGAVLYSVLEGLEEGADATSPIVVAFAAATRTQPQIYFAIPSGIGPALSFAFRGRRQSKAVDGVYGGLVRVAGGFNDTAYIASSANSLAVSSFVRAGGVSQGVLSTNAEALVDRGAAARVQTDDLAFVVDGGTLIKDAAAALAAWDRFVIGGAPWSPGGNAINGPIKSARLWAYPLTDAQLQSASAA